MPSRDLRHRPGCSRGCGNDRRTVGAAQFLERRACPRGFPAGIEHDAPVRRRFGRPLRRALRRAGLALGPVEEPGSGAAMRSAGVNYSRMRDNPFGASCTTPVEPLTGKRFTMRSIAAGGIFFHHPIAFWIGCALLIGGVLSHGPMLAMGAHTHYHLAGMPMDPVMLAGMAIIPLGLLFAAYGLMPRLEQMRQVLQGARDHASFHIADTVPLNAEHWTLVVVLIVALAIDVMKPATLGFVMPGMTAEYAISKQSGGLLALVALFGTTVGSVVWGRIGDVFGRRAAILLSALMFMATAICGAMPTYNWNLAMCFLMGMAAGGMLPIAFTLMAETVPAAHRGWLLVMLGGVGTSAGYLLAAWAATVLEPTFSWR